MQFKLFTCSILLSDKAMSERVKDNAVVCYKAFTQLFKNPRTVYLHECSLHSGQGGDSVGNTNSKARDSSFFFSKIVCDTIVVM